MLLSFHPSISLGVFLNSSYKYKSYSCGCKSVVFFWIFSWQSGILRKNIFYSKNWKKIEKVDQNLAKNIFYLLKNLVFNFYGICSIMKNRLIYCVSTQIPYLGTLLFQRHGRKCSQLMTLPDFLINHISRTNQWNSLPFCMLIQIHKE